MLDNPIEFRKIIHKHLNDMTVTATKVKMYWKGDTLVGKCLHAVPYTKHPIHVESLSCMSDMCILESAVCTESQSPLLTQQNLKTVYAAISL